MWLYRNLTVVIIIKQHVMIFILQAISKKEMSFQWFEPMITFKETKTLHHVILFLSLLIPFFLFGKYSHTLSNSLTICVSNNDRFLIISIEGRCLALTTIELKVILSFNNKICFNNNSSCLEYNKLKEIGLSFQSFNLWSNKAMIHFYQMNLQWWKM